MGKISFFDNFVNRNCKKYSFYISKMNFNECKTKDASFFNILFKIILSFATKIIIFIKILISI